MALLPKISFSLYNTCNKVDVWENTGLYVVSTNETGWGTPNINTSNITAADVKIYNYLGTTLVQTIIMRGGATNVYSGAVSAPTPASFKAISGLSWSQLDGVYKIVYTVSNGATNYVNDCQYELFTCNFCNCMQGLLVKMSSLCSGKKLTRYKEVYDQLEIFLYGIQTAFSNGDFVKVNSLLTEGSKLCTAFSDCDCGCDGTCK